MDDLLHRFRYHQPRSEVRRNSHERVRDIARSAATRLYVELPEGREKSLAITKVEEAMFWANAALAREPDEGGA